MVAVACSPYQRGLEFETWIALCIKLGVLRYVEVGWGEGHTAQYARDHLDADAGVVSIADHEAPSGGPRGGVAYLCTDSHAPDAPARAEALLGGPPDAVFIDASHDYAAVRADFDLWWPCVRALLGMHDIEDFGSRQVWEEEAPGRPSIEIRARDERERTRCGAGAGIGVLFKEG